MFILWISYCNTLHNWQQDSDSGVQWPLLHGELEGTDTQRNLMLSLSKTQFGPTPLPSLRSKAHKVIREILPYIRAWFAFKLGHAYFLTRINCLNTTLFLLPIVMRVKFPTFKVLLNPQICNEWRHFQCLRKLPRCTFGGFSILQRQEMHVS